MSNQYKYDVPFTEDQIHNCYVVRGMTQTETAAEFGVSQKVIWKAMRRMGLKARKAIKRNQRGDKNASWRGGRVLVAKAPQEKYGDRGYWYVLDPLHPNADKRGYVAEHIKVATKQIGRPLDKGECVHHVNLRRHNNKPDNLAVATRRLHGRWHAQLEECAVALMDCGLITFTPERGYVLTERGEALASHGG